jgi:hypothetical protein
MKHRCKFPHVYKLSMVLQIQCIFTPNTATEELEKCINLSFIQGCIKSDLSKFELCMGSERGPRLGGVPSGWAMTLRMVFTIFFKFDNLGRFLRVRVVFSPDGIKPWLLRLFRHARGWLWSTVAMGCRGC